MKVLVLLALAALAAAEADPEADPQLFVHTSQPIAPVVLKTTEFAQRTPVVHAVSPFVTLKAKDHVGAVHVVSPATTPVVTLKTGEVSTTPVVSPYAMYHGYPYANYPVAAYNPFPYTIPYNYFNTPYVVAPVTKNPEANDGSSAVESARKKREADPQLLAHPVVPYVALKSDGEKPVVTYTAGTIPTVGTHALTTVPVVTTQKQKTVVPLTYTVPTGVHPFGYPYSHFAYSGYTQPSTFPYTGYTQPSTFPYTGFPLVYTLGKAKSD
ncbi:uncharacterized protein LOC143020605 isoform X2 [Oratosquilla oratoria]|uniref:uncharacterized protein LOC143020605 isoform X1 n=1 Tax=Oratosquilla oratoria TaxID=337810 RepID=UPI003F76C3DD